MAGIGSSFKTMKLWEASSIPKSTVAVSVPSGVYCLPSAFRNVACVKVRFVWGMWEAWHEFPESNNTFTKLLKILPNTHAILTILAFCDTESIQS